MQPKFTLKKRGVYYLLTPLLSALLFLVAGTLNAQQYINGNLSTGATHSTGTTAPAGTTWSELQGTNSGLGFGANITAGFTLADNFTVPAGPSWALTKVTFFAYSTGYAGATSPFNDVRLQIFNTDPSTGSPTPVYGDLTTNRFSASTTASMYRTSRTAGDQSRAIWKIEATVNTTLAPGSYWIEWALGNGGLSNFTPPSTVVGQPSPAGANSKQHDLTGGTWTNLVDAGGGGAQDQYFIIDYNTGPCNGTPNPGNTISSATTACPGVNFNLSLQNTTLGSGVTYQWQSSPDGTTWTNITGATSATLAANLTATTQYRCNVTCSGNTGTSTPVTVNLTPSSGCYCAAGATSTSFEKISNVTFNTINNNSSSTAGYENFLSQSTTVIKGQTLPISVSISGAFSSDQVLVWIDFNQNGNFSDPGEQVYTSATGVGPHVGNITISPSALTGPTRMRVRMHDASLGANGTPCGNSSYGQVEDYTVDIQPCTPITITTNPANKAVTCGGNTSFTVATSGSAPSYSWEYRTSASSTWQVVTNGGIFSGATTSTLTLTNVIASYNGYQFRALVSGACSAVDFTSVATLTVNPIQPTVNPSSASICLGSVQALSLTNTVSAPTTVTFTPSSTLPLAVPDADPNGVWSTIPVSGIPAGSVITDVSVKFTMTHTWVGDLEINLVAPNGANMNLIGELDNGTGSNGTDNFTNTIVSSTGTTAMSGFAAPRTGTFRADRLQGYGPSIGPSGSGTGYQTVANIPWSALQTVMNGNWYMGFSDWYSGDAGSVSAISISVTYVAPNFAQGVWAGPAGTIFTDAAATTAYTGTPATTVYVKPTTAGVNNYTVNFTTSSPCTSATATIPVTASAPITATTVTPATRAVCVGGSTTFSAAVTGGTNTTYQWQRSTDAGLTWSSISGATSSTLTLSNVTTSMTGYRYRVVATSGACTSFTSTNFGALTVNALPNVTLATSTANIVPGNTSTLNASSSPAAAATNSWSWTLNGSAITGNTSTQTVDIDGLGTYQATVTDVNGCVNKSNELVIGAEASDKLWIYPNPTPGAFQVRLYFAGNTAERRKVSIYDASGRFITSKTFDLNYRSVPYMSMTFDLSGMARGTYVVKVANEYSGRVISGLVLVH